MHSSKMRTGRCSGRLGWRGGGVGGVSDQVVSVLGGVCLGGCLLRGGCTPV